MNMVVQVNLTAPALTSVMLWRQLLLLLTKQPLIDPECEKWNLELDPFGALSLFQQAEIGLRIDIANGQTYYTKRLTQAIEGQKKARAMLDESNLD